MLAARARPTPRSGWSAGARTPRTAFPQGRKAGLQVRDLGEVPLYDENNNVFQGYRTHFKWDCGLTVRDWRFVVRVANINVTSGAVTTSNLINTLITAVNKVPFVRAAGNSAAGPRRHGQARPGQLSFYCNRTVRTALDIQAMAKTNNFLALETRDRSPTSPSAASRSGSATRSPIRSPHRLEGESPCCSTAEPVLGGCREARPHGQHCLDQHHRPGRRARRRRRRDRPS